MQRRHFLSNAALASIGSTVVPWEFLAKQPEFTEIIILHTNDMHSRIDPFPMDGGRNQGMGGVVKRAAAIEKIRKDRENVLLLDAGDIFQGTPYFNFFDGEVEIKAMSQMGYDFATIGNHDFDGGIENLATQVRKASFQMISSNYDFSDTPMEGITSPYQIWNKGGIKIGIYALGIALEGLVPKDLTGQTLHMDPVKAALKHERILKEEEKCDYIICLSHLGYSYRNSKVSDQVIAKETKETDLIIGGHTHTFLREPEIAINQIGKRVLINQVGFAGIMLGRIDLLFEKNKAGKCTSCQNTWLGSAS